MNPREKLLLAIVGGLLVVAAGYGSYRLYARKSAELTRQYRYEQDKLAAAQRARENAWKAERQWRETGRQTLSMDVMAAKGLFREELVKLANQSGMPVPQQTEVILGTPRVLRKDSVTVLPYTVKAEGTLQQIVRFLFELYRQPYLVRCKTVGIEPVMDKAASPNAPPTPSGRLKLNLVVETPILPPDKKVPKVETAPLAPDKRVPVPRTLMATAEDYNNAIKKALFERYTAPPPPPPQRVEPPRVVTTGPGSPPPSLPPPPPDANLVLARVLSSPRSQQVVLEDPNNKSAPDKRVEVGDTLYGGTLIFIHPIGAVSEKDGKRTFHPIGQPLNRGQALSETEHPAVFDALAKLEERLTGIRSPERR